MIEEMRLANAIANSIEPLFNPDTHVVSWRNKEFLLVQVPHSVGPYYAKAKGLKKGTYIRLGSTNRLSDAAILAELERLGENECFDEDADYWLLHPRPRPRCHKGIL